MPSQNPQDSINLPICDLLPEIAAWLHDHDELVLEAPPGAGKTTLVPLSLLDSDWLGDKKILMLEPRRLAARGAAQRMADLLGEPLGERVGYRVRLESKVSKHTRIEVITEGILGRILQDDPALEDVGLLIFDEFHERSLDADVGLALALESRALFSDLREAPLKILVMSATLDGGRIAGLLNTEGVLRSEGRQYPVDIHYTGSLRDPRPIAERMAENLLQIWTQHSGSVLAFLPGQGEILRCESLLREKLYQDSSEVQILIYPLYGNLSLDQQRLAVQPPAPGQRKLVLATTLAESSLTIEGVSVVVDSGLQRQSVFDPNTAMSRLQTKPISKASATQRAGRAGRLEAGHCYRLWNETEQLGLAEFSEPEILQADLAPMALQLLRWGVADPTLLSWLDAPPAAHYQQALDLLARLGAVSAEHKLNKHGEAMADVPVHPRLANMLLRAQQWDADLPGSLYLACELAALLSERDFLLGHGADIELRLMALRGQYRISQAQRGVLDRLKKQTRQFLQLMNAPKIQPENISELPIAALLGLAYPDRIAKCGKARGDYQLANGRRVVLDEADNLAGTEWLLVAELGGQQGRNRDRIYRAAALNPSEFQQRLQALVAEKMFCDWDDSRERFVAEQRCMVGELLLSSKALPAIPEADKSQALTALIRRRGLSVLPLDESEELRARVAVMRALEGSEHWPDWSDTALLDTLEDWLGPYLGPVNSLSALQKLPIHDYLKNRLEWSQQQHLDSELPLRITVPSGSSVRIDYRQNPPVLAVKLQEMFGCEQSPQLAGGRLPLMIHLLSPARRPLQITQDLAGFWRGSYEQVKKEMKGRYPKHPWPDDPLEAIPTARTKKNQY
ncbi:ATP-dependent helicase HrpB [Spongiibacter sp. KMU-158]|uniref:ATP-dependent helicase HrpB n=1 Tax=Spongiibacter pelagi TaxID=2760804 RepID=A0A927GWM3_9GAMM|nr:ATP-dependent helicase HrpB [Spongiibacter pelagi]MBD2859610.1 ATP-dependent helicase HrpB [Spongiibacter pelagi]